ncbi:subtilisin-like protease SBT1.4 [Vigna umbellata]|uniref:subtilisin-like protease SBT1.4 n=1 Tax=Vigna umbellata TaxID=87088 RepID=UPI001F5F00E0|nr:subtilisin-like protease SBT1.4 [Vigna umbellata]
MDEVVADGVHVILLSVGESGYSPQYFRDSIALGAFGIARHNGKIVVCDRGGNARVEKGSAVKLAGGLGMIFTNPAENGEELLANVHLLPATMVGQIVGDEIKECIRLSQYPTTTTEFKGTMIGGSPSATQVASFSSTKTLCSLISNKNNKLTNPIFSNFP